MEKLVVHNCPAHPEIVPSPKGLCSCPFLQMNLHKLKTNLLSACTITFCSKIKVTVYSDPVLWYLFKKFLEIAGSLCHNHALQPVPQE